MSNTESTLKSINSELVLNTGVFISLIGDDTSRLNSSVIPSVLPEKINYSTTLCLFSLTIHPWPHGEFWSNFHLLKKSKYVICSVNAI